MTDATVRTNFTYILLENSDEWIDRQTDRQTCMYICINVYKQTHTHTNTMLLPPRLLTGTTNTCYLTPYLVCHMPTKYTVCKPAYWSPRKGEANSQNTSVII